jgi:hypothetical protein
MMDVLKNRSHRLIILLWLMALHSAGVGFGLILHPDWLMTRAGYLSVNEPFFPVQGGVFHILMAIAYAMAARDMVRHRSLILFSIIVKSTAALFLVLYWLVAARIVVVLVSGLVDALMALVIALGYISWQQQTEVEETDG